MTDQRARGLPSADDLARLIAQAGGDVSIADIVRAFDLKASSRAGLLEHLRQMILCGDLSPEQAGRLRSGGRLPETAILRIEGPDARGTMIARLASWSGGGRPPIIRLSAGAQDDTPLVRGQQVLARIKSVGVGRYEGRVLGRTDEIPPPTACLLVIHDGVLHAAPCDRRVRMLWPVATDHQVDAGPGDIVLVSLMYEGKTQVAAVVERIGAQSDVATISRLAVLTHGIPEAFSAEILDEASRLPTLAPGEREDLRALAFVTIDGEDARDLDDAIWAERRDDGFALMIAIADVAHYVRPGTAIDRAAALRGNSVYFPDRVVPMLPDILSADLCSLLPGRDRLCVYAEIRIDHQGRRISYRFGRATIRSHARLTYERVQAIHDGQEPGPPALQDRLACLWEAADALERETTRRGAMDIMSAEYHAIIEKDEVGGSRVSAMQRRSLLASHRLVELFMCAANAASADLLASRGDGIYRVHAAPSRERTASLRSALAPVARPNAHMAADFGEILGKSGSDPGRRAAILRALEPARYDSAPGRHFGLALDCYVHFTSPIRRYADLVVHRAVLSRIAGGTQQPCAQDLPQLAVHLTMTERRAVRATRDAHDRYMFAYMRDKSDTDLHAHVSGAGRCGLFITLNETGATGLLPIAALPSDIWMHDETCQCLRARRSGMTLSIGMPVVVQIDRLDAATGSMSFRLAGPGFGTLLT